MTNALPTREGGLLGSQCLEEGKVSEAPEESSSPTGDGAAEEVCAEQGQATVGWKMGGEPNFARNKFRPK